MKIDERELQEIHKHFSSTCFNRAWDLIDKTDRSAEEDELMLQLNQASLWHWSQRHDCTDKNLSVGYWQTSRIMSLLRRPDEARRYAEVSRRYSRDTEPFYRGYAFEALARAEATAGNIDKARAHATEARRIADDIDKVENRKQLLDDLDSLSL